MTIETFLKQHGNHTPLYVSRVINTTSGVTVEGHVLIPDDDNFEYFVYDEHPKTFDSIGRFTVDGDNEKLFTVSFDNAKLFGWLTMIKDMLPVTAVVIDGDTPIVTVLFNEREREFILEQG